MFISVAGSFNKLIASAFDEDHARHIRFESRSADRNELLYRTSLFIICSMQSVQNTSCGKFVLPICLLSQMGSLVWVIRVYLRMLIGSQHTLPCNGFYLNHTLI